MQRDAKSDAPVHTLEKSRNASDELIFPRIIMISIAGVYNQGVNAYLLPSLASD
jgi:hypothetical protein